MLPRANGCKFLGHHAGPERPHRGLPWRRGRPDALLHQRRTAVGLLAGYVAGIGAGLAVQWLGWAGRLLQGFAIPAIVGLVVVDIVLVVI